MTLYRLSQSLDPASGLLPDDLDPSRAEASYQLGILTVRIPKKEEAKPRQVTVKAA
jgi:hypothetical protein